MPTLIPSELLVEIFEYAATGLSKNREGIQNLLSASCNVSRSWSTIARIFLYRRIVITTSRSALAFLETLDRSLHGELVQTLFVWTSIYETPGRAGHFAQRKWLPDARRRMCDDRFMDTVLRRCPHLRSFSVHNRSANTIPIILPRPKECSSDILSRLTMLELDFSHSPNGKGHWLPAAMASGRLEFPHLEALRLYSRNAELPANKWPKLPRLRRLVLSDFNTFGNSIALQSLIMAAPVIEELHLFRVDCPMRIILPSTLKIVSIWECGFLVSEIAIFLAPCANYLTRLDLDISLTPTEASTWPHFKYLRRFSTMWSNISPSSIAFLSSILPTLRRLEIMRSRSIPTSGIRDRRKGLARASDLIMKLLFTNANVLEILLLKGNPSINGDRLANTLHKLHQLHTFSLGIYLDNLVVLLERLPAGVKKLDLHLEGTQAYIRRFLLLELPHIISSLQMVAVCVVKDGMHHEYPEYRSTISQLLSLVDLNDIPRIKCSFNERDDDPLWVIPLWIPPFEAKLGLVPAIRKRFRVRRSCCHAKRSTGSEPQ